MRVRNIEVLLEGFTSRRRRDQTLDGLSESRDVRDALLFVFSSIGDDTAMPIYQMKINGDEKKASGVLVLGVSQGEGGKPRMLTGFRLIGSADGEKIIVKVLSVKAPIDSHGRIFVFDGGFSDFAKVLDDLTGYLQASKWK